jgi:hypothetical protein
MTDAVTPDVSSPQSRKGRGDFFCVSLRPLRPLPAIASLKTRYLFSAPKPLAQARRAGLR